ncbi:hypothetical protein P154DRAFT_532359 [Amniculicola lignicola CBS 123094]|uniref:Uncharacterized protein n=1 Tax=Amniculicola lignicola CBS 123094 TaxID=1392246 RepID=A0A6A5WMN1_9PLEO|nr:hypothetical protein P154DRAFT_532359 [Amniculicola lignicola CBS 123094]
MPLSNEDAAYILQMKELIISQLKALHGPNRRTRTTNNETLIDVVIYRGREECHAKAILYTRANLSAWETLATAIVHGGPRDAMDKLWEMLMDSLSMHIRMTEDGEVYEGTPFFRPGQF